MVKQNKKHESGRSMVEVVGVLAIMGLVTAAAFVLIDAGMKSQRMSRTADEIDTLAANVRTLSVDGKDFSNLPTCQGGYDEGNPLAAAILDSAIAPAAVGGNYSICYDANEDNVAFHIMIWNMSDEDCIAMAARTYTGATAECETATYTVKILNIKY